jgi:hypothetical protein
MVIGFLDVATFKTKSMFGVSLQAIVSRQEVLADRNDEGGLYAVYFG